MFNGIKEITMTTVEIAAMTGKRHDNVLRDAHAIVAKVNALKSEECSNNDQSTGAIEATYLDGRKAERPMLVLNKHAAHIIIIEGQAFKADDHGRWDLTDIWRTLKLPKGKQPGQWNNLKEGQYMREMGFSHSAKAGAVTATHANKRATLAYAGWVSRAFETMVYDAFEAILELPEVALLVADKMTALGNDHSATILKRHVFNDKCDWMALKRHHTNSQEGLRNAVQRGNLTHERAVELGLKLGVTR